MRDTNRELAGFCDRCQRFQWRDWVLIIRQPAVDLNIQGVQIAAFRGDDYADFHVLPWCDSTRVMAAGIAGCIMANLRSYELLHKHTSTERIEHPDHPGKLVPKSSPLPVEALGIPVMSRGKQWPAA